jgi:hypothetical protein
MILVVPWMLALVISSASAVGPYITISREVLRS